MSKTKKYVVRLTDGDVKYLKKLRKKKSTSQTIADRCNILLAMDENHPPAKTYDECVMACGPVPEGHSRWTIRLLEDELKVVLDEPISREAIRRTLKKIGLNLTELSTGVSQQKQIRNS